MRNNKFDNSYIPPNMLSRKCKKIIEEYIRKQLEEDIAIDQMVMKEFIDPFTGEKVEEPNKKKKRPFQW